MKANPKKIPLDKQAYLICGEDEFRVESTVRELLDQLVPEADRAFGLDVVDGRVENVADTLRVVQDVRGALVSDGLFGGGAKTVWFKEPSFLSVKRVMGSEEVKNAAAALLKQVKDGLPEGSRLVVTASAVNRAQSFFKTFDAAGVVVDFGSNLKAAERDVNAAMLLDECLPKIPLKMGQAEKHAFLARAGTDSLRIVSELQKLACYCGKRAVATAEDIETVVSRNSVSEVWALTDAFSRRDKTETVRQVRRQLDQGENAIYLAQMLLGTVSDLLAVRDALDRGWAAAGRDGVAWQALPEEVAEGLSQGEKDVRKSLVGWRGKKVADYARQWKTRELRLARHHLVKLREELVSSQVPEDFLLATRVLQAMG